MNIKISKLSPHGNADEGHLCSIEFNKAIPFEVKRIYYTYEVPVGKKRGMHAHKKLRQLLWCPYGQIKVVLDNGKTKESFLLDSPEKNLLVLEGYWHDMYWEKEGSVLCVAASDYYNEEDYIRDYDEFLKYIKDGYWDDEN